VLPWRVAALSNENNEILERYSYDVFGQPTIRDAGYVPRDTSDYNNPYLFTGRRYDEETALYYYRARYYAYDIGRFLNPDPIGYSGGFNFSCLFLLNITTPRLSSKICPRLIFCNAGF